MANALDAVLAQYDKNSQSRGGGDGMTQEATVEEVLHYVSS